MENEELTAKEKAKDLAKEIRAKNKEANSIDFAKYGIKRFRDSNVSKQGIKKTKK